MTDDPSPEIDRYVRDAFATDPDAVERVATRALDGHSLERPRGWTLRLTVAGAVVAVMATAMLWPSRPVPEVAVFDSLSGSLTDGVLVVSLPDGSISIIGAHANEDRPPSGYGIVLVEGEVK